MCLVAYLPLNTRALYIKSTKTINERRSRKKKRLPIMKAIMKCNVRANENQESNPMKTKELHKYKRVSTETNRKIFTPHQLFNKMLALMPIKSYMNYAILVLVLGIGRESFRSKEIATQVSTNYWYIAPLDLDPGAATYGGDWVPP